MLSGNASGLCSESRPKSIILIIFSEIIIISYNLSFNFLYVFMGMKIKLLFPIMYVALNLLNLAKKCDLLY